MTRTRVVMLAVLAIVGTIPPAGGAPAPVSVIAHRGASYDAPEHTVPAYDRAVAYGADFLECDLQLTKDSVLVCVHDTSVDRTSNGSGRVDSFTLAQLRKLDFGSWFNEANPGRARAEFRGARVVTLEEQLRCYRPVAPHLRFHLETKAPAEYGGRMEPLLVALLKRHRLLVTGGADRSRVVIQSFELDSLKAVKRLAPSLVTAWLWTAPPPEGVTGVLPAEVDVAAPISVHPQADVTFVSRMHAAGHQVHPWTVDDPGQMDRLIAAGVDGIFSNRADVLRRRVDAAGRAVPGRSRPDFRRKPAGCATSRR